MLSRHPRARSHARPIAQELELSGLVKLSVTKSVGAWEVLSFSPGNGQSRPAYFLIFVLSILDDLLNGLTAEGYCQKGTAQ